MSGFVNRETFAACLWIAKDKAWLDRLHKRLEADEPDVVAEELRREFELLAAEIVVSPVMTTVIERAMMRDIGSLVRIDWRVVVRRLTSDQ